VIAPSPVSGTRVTVVGLGVSGFAAARALIGLGATVRVTESATTPAIEARAASLRAQGAFVETGGHDLVWLAGFSTDLAVVSPGVPPRTPVIGELRRLGAEIISEIELAFRLSNCDFLAVTGTNGKTTTTSLLAAMLQEGGIKSAPAGNIGLPLVEAIASIPDDGAIVAEVSSFQLETIDSFRPEVAVLLNVAPDHIDWHGTQDEYVSAKARIVENQDASDVFVFNADDADSSRIAMLAPGRIVPFSGRRVVVDGVGVRGHKLVYRGRDLIGIADISLPGIPGREDVAAAACAALEYGVEVGAVVRAIKAFRPLRHRLEIVAELNGITFINDSKATNPHATLAAVQGLRDVVLIAGGQAKGIDLHALASTVPPVRAVVAIGEAATEVEDVFQGRVPVKHAQSMAEAVRLARSQSIPGGSVLLAPGCASLDMFESYAARGEAFVRAVREHMEGKS
jgi:UDP-N-acetylmuramoylalanine--D-glutamate ligase